MLSTRIMTGIALLASASLFTACPLGEELPPVADGTPSMPSTTDSARPPSGFDGGPQTRKITGADLRIAGR